MNYEELKKALETKSAEDWEEQGEELALRVFREASKRVPAYKKFLATHGLDPSSINTMEDFRTVPLCDKDNYIKAYPIEDLAWDGKLENNTLFSVSSGSSGTPFFWPRGTGLELETSAICTLILKDFFDADKKSTLFVNSFSMGVYIAGVIILNAVLRTAERGYPISIITPGVNMPDVLRSIKELGGKYDQVVLAGYPPFVKDILDTGIREGIDWKQFNMKFFFATENFSETFRNYIGEQVGAQKGEQISINIYGSAESGILGHETPETVDIRRIAEENDDTARALWGSNPFTPTFVQYHPAYKYFEEVNGEIILSAFGGIPLVRYNFHDNGRVQRYQDIENILGKNMPKNAWKLPFISVFGKSDQTISFYGLQIYPEHVREGLSHENITAFVTGRFVMRPYTDIGNCI